MRKLVSPASGGGRDDERRRGRRGKMVGGGTEGCEQPQGRENILTIFMISFVASTKRKSFGENGFSAVCGAAALRHFGTSQVRTGLMAPTPQGEGQLIFITYYSFGTEQGLMSSFHSLLNV